MEQIYTIPVNEAFDDSRDHPECGCPLCTLYRKLEEDELSLILGASMMEPDIRIRTNKEGFCTKHFSAMLTRKNRLGLALMLESHLGELAPEVFPSGLGALGGREKSVRRLDELDKTCYVCSRVAFNLTKMTETVVLLWEEDGLFREKFNAQPHFCIPHYRELLRTAQNRLGRKAGKEFIREIEAVEGKWFSSLRDDVSAFCRSFDYRAGDEPLTQEQKRAVERAVMGLSGLEGREIKPC